MATPLQACAPQRDDNVIQLKLRDIAQLFNSLDPSPFNEKDLDDDAEEFIVSWAREISSRKGLRLVIHLEVPLPPTQSAASVDESVRHYFAYRASIAQLELGQFLRRGRLSLLIGGGFLSGCLLLSQLIAKRAAAGVVGTIAEESLTIGGWVAMWRPMEIYLYDWWPLWRRRDLLRKLSHIKVQLHVPNDQNAPKRA
jgi:hypothetical protein